MARPRNVRDFFEVFRAPTDAKDKDAATPVSGKETADPKTSIESEKPSQAMPEIPAAKMQPPAPEPTPEPALHEAAPSDKPKIFATGGGRVAITLTNEAFAAAVVIGILLLALAFAAGNWNGRRAASHAAATPPAAVAPQLPKKEVVQIPTKKSHETGIVRREALPPTKSGKEALPMKTAPRPAPAAAPPKPPEPSASYWTLQVISGINPNKAEQLKAVLEREGYPNVVVKPEGRYSAVRLGRFDSRDSAEAQQFKKLIGEMKFEGKLQFTSCFLVKVE